MRLTIRNSDGTVSQPTNLDWSAALEKLATYEDMNLTPEEFHESVAFVLELNKKLKPYMDAEEQGRLVILPCKIGDTVYHVVSHTVIVSNTVDVTSNRMEWKLETTVEPTEFCIWMVDSVGKTVFLTREEAEAALKGGTVDV